MSLFRLGGFTLHSGRASDFKVECEALTGTDWHTLATLAARLVPPFRTVDVLSAPAKPLASFLVLGRDPKAKRILLVDDVWTTGATMSSFAVGQPGEDWAGLVVFARGGTPPWVHPIFTLHPRLW